MDGVNIITGTWDRGDSTFLYDGNPEGPHAGDIGTLTGTVTMANETYMNSGWLIHRFRHRCIFRASLRHSLPDLRHSMELAQTTTSRAAL